MMKLEKKIYTDRAEKRKDLLRGAGLFFGLNVPLYLMIRFVIALIWTIAPDATNMMEVASYASYIGLYLVLPLLINIVVLVYLAITRSWIALGMLAAMGVLLALGLIVTAACFVLIELTL